jgi:replicative DNA helicase
MKWIENSELVAGLVITGKLSVNSVRPEIFMPPYDEVIKRYKNGRESVEELIESVGLTPINACLEAANTVNGLSRANWVAMLENSYNMYSAGMKMEKLATNLKKGKEIEWGELVSLSAHAQRGSANDFTPLSEIEGGKVPFIDSGWEAFDEHVGGLPCTGLVVVGGNPGVGKTSYMTKTVSSFATKHNKSIAVFSIEMVLSEIAYRFRETNKLPKSVEQKIQLCDLPVSPEEVINKATTIENLGLVTIDFADLMIRGDTTESSMAHIYRTLMLGAKQLHCPIILLSQLNRNYKSGIPRPNNLRYTGLAESLGWMILMLYDPSRDWLEDDSEEVKLLPVVENKAYIIVWKVRGGFRKHLDESPGAIMLPFRGDKGWGSHSSSWFSLRKLS